MQTLQHKIDTNTPIDAQVNINITRSEDANDCLIAHVNGVEYAYVWINDNPIEVGSDEYHLTKEEEKAIILQVGLFLENEPQEETTDYTYDVRDEQSFYHYGY